MRKKLDPATTEVIRQIANGSYNPEFARFNERAFRKDWHVPFLVVFGFLRRFSLREFHIVQGDPLLAMVASEIWVYNISRTLIRDGGIDASNLEDDDSRRGRLQKCNAYSIAQSLRVPPETVRRKVKTLITMGWVDKSGNGQLMITKKCEDAFNPESNLETMRDFISTARSLFQTMGLELVATHEAKNRR